MENPTPLPNPLQKIIKRLAGTRFGISLLAGTLHRLDAPILKRTHNRTSLTTWLTGLPVVVLTTTGAKSSLTRCTPLIALVEGEKIILIASQFGRPHHPGWYYNLKAHPLAQVSFCGTEKFYLARQAQGEERLHYWLMATEIYGGYTLYEQQAHPRIIPVMVLEPVEDDYALN